MAASNYEACLKKTLQYEGGYSNHPADPGGVTLEGVIQTVYNAYRKRKGRSQRALVKSMRGTPEWIAERNEIYRTGYWDRVRGDGLAAGVDMVTFDFGVNSGPSRALKYLKLSLGGTPVQVIKTICAKRLGFVRALKTWASFGKGWGSRIHDVEAVALKMAYAATGASAASVTKSLRAEATAATTQKKTDVAKAAGSVAAPASTQVPDTVTTVDVAQVAAWGWSGKLLLAAAAIAIAGAAFAFIRKAVINHKRAKALAAVALEK